ncbi:MAG TPA: hypothetical protein GX401_07225 [Clostridiales bacterium]|nr:hypothetical protein [Clostridiales bacterium]
MNREEVLEILQKLEIQVDTDQQGEDILVVKDSGDNVTNLSDGVTSLVMTDKNGIMSRLTICVKSVKEMVVDVENVDFQKAYTYKDDEFLKEC